MHFDLVFTASQRLLDHGRRFISKLAVALPKRPEYLVISELSALGHMDRIGWIRGEWHSRKDNLMLASFLGQTHAFNIDPNHPRSVGMFVAHRM